MDYGETEEVQETHAAIQREKREPRAGLEPLSLWLIALYGLAVFFGGAYLGRYSGNFSGDGLDPLGGAPRAKKTAGGGEAATETVELTPAERGKKIFSANCVTCHQTTGLGVAGQYPPLAGSEIVNGGARRPAMIVLKGLVGPVTVKGQQFGSAVMQPWEKTLNDQKIADVLTFVRQEWGNTGWTRFERTDCGIAQGTCRPHRIVARSRLKGGPRRCWFAWRRTGRRSA